MESARSSGDPLDPNWPPNALPLPLHGPAWDGGSGALGAGLLFEAGLDGNALDRMLLALAVHGAGGGLKRAHLLIWNPLRGLLEGRLAWTRAPHPRPLADALAHARRRATDGADADATRTVRSLAMLPEELGPVPRAAWVGGISAVGEAAEFGLLPDLAGQRRGAIALHRADRAYGLIVGDWEEGEAVEALHARLEGVRRLGSHALSVHARAEESRRLLRQAAAIAEMARAGVSSLNLAEVLQTATRLGAQASGARGSAIWLASEREGPAIQSTHGPAGARERIAGWLEPLAAATIEQGRAILRERAMDEPRLAPEAAAQLHGLAVLPLSACGRCFGAFAVYDRAAFHPAESAAFDSTDLAFLGALADLTAAAIEQAGRTAEIQRARQRREESTRQLARSERLAALGEIAARVAQEAKNPVTSIAAFARRVMRQLPENDAGREYLEIVIREADRLEHLIGEQLQYAELEPTGLRLENLNELIQQSLQHSSEALVRRRVRLLKKLAPDVPPLLLDAERIRRVVANVLAHVLDAVGAGGRVRVESRRVQQHVVVEIGHDAPRPPGEVLNELFVPFAPGRPGAPSVGLAIAQQIVQRHGGEIRVRSEGEWSTVFSFTLPIPLNQDRRHVGSDRRLSRADRRARNPAS